MEQHKTRILAITPYEGMHKAMARLADEYTQAEFDIFTADLEEGVDIVNRNKDESYDVIISRGGTAELIARITDIPVISIQLSVYDVLRAIKMAENYSSLYAVVGFPSITEPAHVLCDLLRYDVDIITVHNSEEVGPTLERLRLGGYKMVVGDMVTHTIARQMGFDAFLITSGVESLRTAADQAVAASARFRQLRMENFFLTRIAREKDGNTIILDPAGELCYFTPHEPTDEQLKLMRSRLRDVPASSTTRFYHNNNGNYYQVSARSIRRGPECYIIFRYRIAQISLRGEKAGLRSFNMPEISQLFTDSFYSISGAMGELEPKLAALAATKQPVMILGESGTGKEQIARVLYLRGSNSSEPFWTIDCSLMSEKSWSFLFNNYSSPLNESGGTVYFQHLESLPGIQQKELMAVLLETNVAKRIRLLFSCTCQEGEELPQTVQEIASRCACITLHLPTLRSRTDEIPSLASLYIGSLNTELGKSIIGLDPGASEQLLHYDWPNNYIQFKEVLSELVTFAASSYIRSGSVAEILSRQRQIYRQSSHISDEAEDNVRTLDSIIKGAIHDAVSRNNGNQTAAANQLGISRTTLWRHISRTDLT